MSIYYNENDPFAAQWLRKLIKAKHIADGKVDERSIEDVLPNDLNGFTQHHFFAGIGGWSLALRQAGWPDNRPVWTGSCPCQPFSPAGKKKGFADERHIWPSFFHLIRQCRPVTVFGEQVAGKNGETWLDLVQNDLEGENYTVGACVTSACSVGAPHMRKRLYWVADSNSERQNGVSVLLRKKQKENSETSRSGSFNLMDNSISQRLERQPGDEHDKSKLGQECPETTRPTAPTGPVNGFWREADWLYCRDGKWRAVEPGTFPLAHGVSGRMGKLRGYGNAIVIPQAQAFIEAYIDF